MIVRGVGETVGVKETLSQRALNRATLARQLLLERSTISAVEAVEHLVGLQAQAPFSPYYQLWSRLAGFRPDDLAKPILDRDVVRIVVMRGTIHLLSASDALRIRPLVQPIMDRDLDTNPTWSPGMKGLDRAEFASFARTVLRDDPLTMAEMSPVFAEQFPGFDPKSLAHAARGLLPLVQVPPRAVWGRSGQTRLTPLESWVERQLEPSPSIADLAWRYFAAFGPASVADLQTWVGLTKLKEVVDDLRPRLHVFCDEDGKELFDVPDGPRPDPDVRAPVRFLPDFDNLIRSHANRRRVIDDASRKRLNTRNGVTPHSILVDGHVAGMWRVSEEDGVATLRVEELRPLSDVEHADVAAEGKRLLEFAHADAEEHRVKVVPV